MEVPQSFADDEVAVNTNWEPLAPGGSNFKTLTIVPVDDRRIEFRASLGLKIFAFVFISVGAVPVLLTSQGVFGDLGEMKWFMVLFGAMFGGAGLFIYLRGTRPIVFDKDSGFYWKGRKRPVRGLPLPANATQLDDIYAIQLISERVTSDDSSYYSYELNLVLNDGNRLNVADHGSRRAVDYASIMLSEFLGVPVWDAT